MEIDLAGILFPLFVATVLIAALIQVLNISILKKIQKYLMNISPLTNKYTNKFVQVTIF